MITTPITHRYTDTTTVADARVRMSVPEMPAIWTFATKNHGERPHGAPPG